MGILCPSSAHSCKVLIPLTKLSRQYSEFGNWSYPDLVDMLLVSFQQGLKPRLFALHTGMHIDQHGFAIGI